MNKNIWLVVVGLGVVVLGIGLWMSQNNSDNMESQSKMMEKGDVMMEKEEGAMEKEDVMMEKEAVMMEKEEGTMEKGDAMAMSDKRYVEYGPDVLEKTKNTRRVLFFYANWCPVCKPADAEFQSKMSDIPSDVTVIRVNFNDTDTDEMEKDLATKYGVTYQHSFVQIDQEGNAVTKWNGGKLSELLKNIR